MEAVRARDVVGVGLAVQRDDDESGLNRLDHEIPVDDGWGWALNGFQRIGCDGPLSVKRATERIDHATEQCRSHGHAHHIARADYRVASLDPLRIVQKNAADAVAFEHLGEAELSFLEAQKLIEPNVGQSRNEGDTVPDLLDPADLFGVRA